MNVLGDIRNILHSNNQRTALLKKNILGSFVIKGWNCVVQLLLVPITLNCLTQYEYGIWLTINSVLVWIDSFDIGLGNGLRNQLTKSIAELDMERGRRQVSTTLVMLCLIVVPVILLLLVLVHNSNCYAFFNVDRMLVPNLEGILMVSIAMVGASFIFKFIGNVYLAMQLPAINNLLVALGQTIALVLIFLASLLGGTKVSLLAVALMYTVSPLIVYIISYPITFKKYSQLWPSIRMFDKKEIYPLFSLGIKFFFVQVSVMVIFTTSNILISRLFSPSEVAPYQVANRYFGLTNILFTLMSAPLWSATTDAYTKNDWGWINSMVRKMNIVVYVFIGLILIMLLLSNTVYHLWIGEKLSIPFALSSAMAVYMVVILYGTCYSNILCGFGKIRLLTIVSIFQACIYIPVAVKLGHIYGVEGIVLSLIIVSSISAFTNKYQYKRISNHTAKGILDK